MKLKPTDWTGRTFKSENRCILCKEKFSGFGNNPEPLSNTGRCCEKCNMEKVIPARMKVMLERKKNEKE